MFNRRITKKPRQMVAAFCGSLSLSVCCILWGGNEIDCSYVGNLLAQDSSVNKEEAQIVYFPLAIDVDEASLFASPSTQSYRTGSVNCHEVVEVYFRNSNGFCAIRPPQGSFSWINSKFVELESSNTGRVFSESGKAVPVRVGGQTPLTSTVVQVGLKEGQTVKIIDEVTLSDDSVWYKIAPPPGEFRWILDTSLGNSRAIVQLPSRLTFRNEYLQRFSSPVQKVEPSNLDSSHTSLKYELPTDAQSLPVMDSLTNVGVQNSATGAPCLARDEFQQKLIALNSDTLATLQNPIPSANELDPLQARAEELFDRAPSDADRYIVQSIFDAISRAQIQQQNRFSEKNSYHPDMRHVNSAQQLSIPPLYSQMTFQQNDGQNSGMLNRALLYPSLPDGPILLENSQIVDESFLDSYSHASNPNDQFFYGVTVSNDESDKDLLATKKRNPTRLGFAFANNPFRTSSTSKRQKTSRMEPSLAHLPGLERDYPTSIVPPQNYNTREFQQGKTANLNKLLPGPLRNKQQVQSLASTETSSTTSSAQAQQERIVFQSPQIALNTPNAPLIPQSNESRWQTVSSDLSKSTTVSRLPSEPTDVHVPPSSIRQTSVFTPVTSKSFENNNSAGMLIELTNTSNGSPQYALINQSGHTFNIIAYLDAGKGVSLDKFVGRQVVVKGSIGAVTFEGKTLRHIVVSSLYLQE